jgi:hypothetical protein
VKLRLRLLVSSALASAGLLLVPLAAVQAADPSAGTVSEQSPSVTWSGPAVAVPTASSNCGGPDNPSCDNFKLTIQPPSYAFQVVVNLQPFAEGDWDLQVWTPSGALAGSSGNNPGMLETVVLVNPAAGTYTVSGSPFAPAPGTASYTASAEIVRAEGGSAPPNGTEHVTYANHAAPDGLGQDSGEPSIGGNATSGNVMFQAGLEALRVTFDDSTSPATASWKDVSFLTSSIVSLDPIGFLDRRTGRWFSSQLSGTTSLAAFTDNDGDSWTPSEGGPGNGGVDHQTIGGGPYHSPLSGTIYPNAVYYCSQDIVTALCARSDNGGVTFNPATPVWTSECSGLHGHVKVAPDGTVYVPNKNCGNHQGVAVSTDNGASWAIRTVAASGKGDWDPSVALASDGTAYLGYDDVDGHARIAVSHDQGRTWASVTDVGAALGVVHSAFPAVVAGDPGRAAFAFLGSTNPAPGAMGDDPSWPGEWHLYVSQTYDGGATWTTVDATPNDPVQRGTICGGGFGGCDNGTRNLLDFMDASIDKDGRVIVGYADGCIDACVAGGPGSFTAVATIAREVSGKRMFAANDPSGAPSAPFLTAKHSAGPPEANVLSWQEPDDHGSAITAYRIYRNGTLLATAGGGARGYVDTAVVAGTTYSYAVSAVNAAGEGAKSPAVTPTVPPPPQDPCQEPGVKVLTDASGDALDGRADHDVQWAAVAEPPSIGAGNVEFLLKMSSLASPSPSTSWPIVYQTPGGTDRWVAMKTNALGQVSFELGAGTTPSVAGTAADPQSGFSPDGLIRIVVPRSAIGVSAGSQLTQFLVRIRVEVPGGSALTPDNMPDSLARTGSYTVKGNESCPVPAANLAVSADDIGFVQEKGKNGSLVTIVATVHNLGTLDATGVGVTFAVDGTTLGTPTIQRVVAGSFARASVQWDAKQANGDHTVSVTADPANTVAESNEDDNSASRVITVKGTKVKP